MITIEQVAFNPLPWFIGPDGQWLLSSEALELAFPVVRDAGFRAVTIDVPVGMSTGHYGATLDAFGLKAGPGAFAGAFEDANALLEILESARRHIDVLLELGQRTTFIGSGMAEPRIVDPAVGAAADDDRLSVIVTAIERVAALMHEHGVTACIHPHVGTWVETEHETETVLARISDEILSFGPDTGHLYWAGMDPAEMIARHAHRVRGIHIKDAHADRIAAARADRLGYYETAAVRKIWTEPGRGDVDFQAVFAALPDDFGGWCVIEVDVPDMDTTEESTMYCGSWVREQFGSPS